MSERITILPPRAGETDDEQRLRETINRLGGQILSSLDAAIKLRDAPQEARDARHAARRQMTNFALGAMHAMAYSEAAKVKADS